MTAWENVLFYQNSAFLHSWFIRIKIEKIDEIPLWWFFKFWTPFGAQKYVLPATVQHTFQKYVSLLKNENKGLFDVINLAFDDWSTMMFFAYFSIP